MSAVNRWSNARSRIGLVRRLDRKFIQASRKLAICRLVCCVADNDLIRGGPCYHENLYVWRRQFIEIKSEKWTNGKSYIMSIVSIVKKFVSSAPFPNRFGSTRSAFLSHKSVRKNIPIV